MKSILITGLIITLIPFLGFPGSWETFLFVVLGLYIFGRSFYFYKFGVTEKTKEEKDYSYTQNDDIAEIDDEDEDEEENIIDNSEEDKKSVENENFVEIDDKNEIKISEEESDDKKES